MSAPKSAPYGSWKSPITSDLIVSDTVRLFEPRFDGNDLYWLESRPSEKGRIAIVRRSTKGTVADVIPPPFNARSRVHEYGGGSYVVTGGMVFFVNFEDQRIYRIDPGSEPKPITPESALRYADFAVDTKQKRLICVCEDHSKPDKEPVNSLIAIDMDGKGPAQTLVSRNDFYSTPRISDDGSRLAWLTWNHPNMPWDGTELWAADIGKDGALGEAKKTAGGKDESIFQPEWSPDGDLYFVSDKSGWWNIHRSRDGAVKSVCPMEAEFGQPQWVFGLSNYGFSSADEIICAYIKHGRRRPARIDTRTGILSDINIPYSADGVIVSGQNTAFIGGSPVEPRSVVLLDTSSAEYEIIRRSSRVTVDPGYISQPQSITFPTSHNGLAHALFYPPHNRDFTGPSGEKPPLRVISHGGPTSAASDDLDLAVQFWTSRGFAVLNVDYRGSTGHGRSFMKALRGNWGIYDVDDCAYAAMYMAKKGAIDPDRLAIKGGSAGGYTTLCALTFRDEFKAGASYYGVGDLEALARDTHKFESRYLDSLVGPYPERKDIYQERSPIHYVDKLDRPVIFFQGLDDKVVPPNQAETMVAAVRAKGLPVAYVPFEGEGHGFRRAENIKRSLEAELYFYSRIFNFAPTDEIEPVEIDNL